MRRARPRGIAAAKKAVPWSELFAAAAAARLRAYAPYSKFAVGAAVSLLTGRSMLYSGFRQVGIGAAAAAVTYLVGSIIGVAAVG